MTIKKYYLVVDNENTIGYVVNAEMTHALATANQVAKRFEGRVVRAVMDDEEGDEEGEWSCGDTFVEAIKNLEAGIHENFE